MERAESGVDLSATHFARAGRSSIDELTEQIKRSLDDPCFNVVLEAVHGYVAVLNEHRQIRATPLHLGGSTVTAAVFQDVSAVKRREVLEQVFFHGLLNTLGGIAGWTELLKASDQQSAAREIAALAEGLKEEILSQRTMLAAERGDLAITLAAVDATELAARLSVIFEHHPDAETKRFVVRPLPERHHLRTDPVLLLRVLVNMVKNAFEASVPGAAVALGFEWVDGKPSFVVHNETAIPDDVREHIFERSYSTKARHGRGTGTYSMKLYGENYLHGSVTFTSDAANGTTFRITLPSDEPVEPIAPSSLPATAASTQPRILLVDDSEQLLRLGSLMLTRLGYEVTACRGGTDALAALDGTVYAAMVTDWMMEGMDGRVLIDAVSHKYPALPIVVCSGYGDSVTAPAQVRHRIGKPFTLKELQATLAAALAA